MKLLYVEDEPALGRIVKESLESRGFDMQMVADGAEVMKAFAEFNPDVCILDIMLPNKSGFELAQEIRERNPRMPILFLTAKNQTADLIRGFEVGGNDYIRKPFSMEELIVRIHNIRKLFDQAVSESDPKKEVIQLGSLCYYPDLLELRSPDAVFRLSYREAELLSILVENLQTKTLRKDLLMRVWGDDSYFNSRNLDVYITRLRDYFKADGRIQIITLKGVGYILKVS